jgi:N utilization substance protein B
VRIPPRRRARELALQGLYQWQLAGGTAAQVLKNLSELEGFERADGEFLKAGLKGTIEDFEPLRAQLEPLADRRWAGMSPVERAILLLGAWELNHCPEVPYRVSINEAIELAKRYGGTDGHKYVNGVLDRLAAQVRPDEVAAKKRTPA